MTVAVLAPVCTHNHKFLFRALLFGLEEDVKRGMALCQSTARFTGTRTPVSDRTHDPNVRTSTVLYSTHSVPVLRNRPGTEPESRN